MLCLLATLRATIMTTLHVDQKHFIILYYCINVKEIYCNLSDSFYHLNQSYLGTFYQIKITNELVSLLENFLISKIKSHCLHKLFY